MSTCIWQGGAISTPQVDSITPANVNIGNTFTATINGKSVTVTATAATVANVTGLLAAAIEASDEPEFAELTATDNTTNVLVTGPDDGTPFTLTSSATGGTATNTRASVTAPVSPYDWNTAANWSGGAVPVTGDTVIFDATSTVDVLYGLDQSAVTLAVLNIAAGYTGSIGLPERNSAGFNEYRATYLKVGATASTIGYGTGAGSARIKLDNSNIQATVAVLATGPLPATEPAALLWKGTHASNAVNVGAGSVGIAALAGETATVATLRVGAGGGGSAPAVLCGSGVTLTTLVQSGGDVTLNAGLTTATLTDDGALSVFAGNVTTANIDGGTFYYEGTGTITTLKVSAGGTADFTRDPRTRTVTDCTVNTGAKIDNRFMTAAFTNAVVYNRCSMKDVDMNFGTHLSLTVAAGP